MIRSIFIATALCAVIGAPLGRAVHAQELQNQADLLRALRDVKKGMQIRFHTINKARPEEYQFRHLRNDSLVLRRGRELRLVGAQGIDSLWVRDAGSSSAGKGALLGGAIGGLALLTFWQSLSSDGGIGLQRGPVVGAVVAGFVAGALVGGIVGAVVSSGSGPWLMKYPAETPDDSNPNTGRHMDRLKFGITPDLKTGVRLAASYSF